MNNSEILFIYDAKLTNPNGDPDEENRPRMDYENNINLVSDLRLKRYIRDYFQMQGMDIFVRLEDDKNVEPEDRVKKLENNDIDTILNNWIDVRLFGAIMPIKNDTKTFIGPLQFNWGYSLNEVELIEASITSHFKTGSSKTQGAIGKDYRVKYSLIAFSGVLSGNRAEKTKLTNEDINYLDNAMIKAIPLLSTRSKVGQYPRIYVRVEYNDNETIIGDFRDYISLVNKKTIRKISDAKIDVTKFVKVVNDNIKKINNIFIYIDPMVTTLKDGEKFDLTSINKTIILE